MNTKSMIKQIDRIKNNEEKTKFLCKFALTIWVIFCAIMLVKAVHSEDTDDKAAYIVKLNSYAKSEIVSTMESLGLTVDIIEDRNIRQHDLTQYRLVVFDEGALLNSRYLDISQFHSVIMNKDHGKLWGLSDADGISSITSTRPMAVVDDKNTLLQVYNQSRDGFIFIPMYYIKDSNSNLNNMVKLARLNSSSPKNKFYDGSVVGIIPAGQNLTNGKIARNDICFFGIIKSKFWTNESRRLFFDCANSVMEHQDDCESDQDCDDGDGRTQDICLLEASGNRCVHQDIRCFNDSECGDPAISDHDFCLDDDVYRATTELGCENPGTAESRCVNATNTVLIEDCDDTCENGVCTGAVCGNDLFEPGEECESGNQCQNTSCEMLDGCVGTDYHDYDDVLNSCNECSCTSNNCRSPRIYKNDIRCFSCSSDDDCNLFDAKNCQADTISMDEGVCMSGICQIQTTPLEDCAIRSTRFNSCGQARWSCVEEYNEVICAVTAILPNHSLCPARCASNATLVTGLCMNNTYRCQYRPSSCSDGNAFNGIERCSGGTCVFGTLAADNQI